MLNQRRLISCHTVEADRLANQQIIAVFGAAPYSRGAGTLVTLMVDVLEACDQRFGRREAGRFCEGSGGEGEEEDGGDFGDGGHGGSME